jgi:hypothetical protein
MAGGVEGLKDYISWQSLVKSYLIKKEDEDTFGKYKIEDQMLNGVNVPYQDVIIYTDNGKSYAKFNQNSENSVNTEVQVVQNNAPMQSVNTNDLTPKQPQQPQQQVANKEHQFYLEVAINDETGEPYIIFKNNAPINSMESKIMKSFILKAKKDSGIAIKQGEEDTIQIVLC